MRKRVLSLCMALMVSWLLMPIPIWADELGGNLNAIAQKTSANEDEGKNSFSDRQDEEATLQGLEDISEEEFEVMLLSVTNDKHGNDFTTGELAQKLETIIYSGISGCVSPSLPAVGSSFSKQRQYHITYANQPTDSGFFAWQCAAYAAAVYSYLFGYSTFYENASVNTTFRDATATTSLGYEQFNNWDIRCGAFIRTTSNSDGSWNSSVGHSMIVLSYDRDNIVTLEGNWDGAGGIAILTQSWSEFNRIAFRSGRRVCFIRQPVLSIYNALTDGTYQPPTPVDPPKHVHETIRKNSTGVCVRELQEMLNWFIDNGLLSAPRLDVDGSFGNATDAKLREFQRNAGLDADGVCGSATWAALENPPALYSTFDLNWVIDGEENWLSQPYVTVDIYVNDVLVVDDCADYSGEWRIGDSYRIEDIKVSPLCKYEGPDLSKGGNITGTIGSNTTYVFLKLSILQCADVGTDFYAYIINTASRLHLTNDGDGNVTARTGEDATNQVWRFERLGNGAYKITSLIDSNQCLDVANFGQTSGTNVGIANANGGSAQQWFIYGENGAYAFRAECTNCVMDITNSNYVSGVNVQMWKSNGTDAQKFQIWNLGSPSKTLDINWMLDGNQVWGEQEYGTVDVYINGVLDADDVTDYCKEFPMGTRYEITDIKARDGHISQGVHSGSLSGMLVHDSVEVWISFATLANLGVNGWLDGQYTGGLGTDAFNYATVDVYINGELKADDVSYYYVGWPVGTTYEIKDIKANPGYSYVGIHNGTLSGTIGADHANVAFDFATVHYLDLNSYLDEAYSGNLGDYGTIDVYVNGVLVKDDVTDYYAELPVGTTYEIKDVKPRAGCSYNGIREGTRTGSIGSENVAVVFDFSNIQTSNLPSASKQETFNGHTYKFYSDAVTWYTAKLLCESMGGHLVTITSKEEDQFIKSFSDGKYAHIGATDANSEGHWEWVTGELFSYENWIAPPDNYPINDEGCENYTHLRDDGLWNDFPGYITYPFICEFDSVEPTQFVIAYDSNGGSGTMSDGLATEGSAYTLPENAFTPPEDKQFKAWGIGDEEYSPGSSYTFTANSTVRAIWENASNSTSQIMIGNQSALKGATLEIPVTIKNNPGIAGATLTVSYDESALTLNDIIKGALFENGSYSANSETGVVQWYHTENVTDDGVLFTLQFAVNGNAQNGSYTIAVGLRDGIPANLSNADSNIVTVQFVSGILEITSGIRGDVTGDGVVAINDVVKLARAVAGSLTLTEAEIAVADVTGDGVIAINDVVKLARHVAGNLASLQSADNASLLDGESAVISIETYSGMPGETVQIPVSITQNPGIAGMQLDILFDSGLTLKNIIRGAVLSAGTFNPDVSNGRVQWYYEQANVTDIGVLFTLEFEVNAEARSGAYAVAVNLKDGITANLSDYDFNPVSVDFTSGKVQIIGSTIDTAINTVSRSGNTITANVVCADSNASVFCAVYNNSGKMIAVRSAQITGESNYQFQFDRQQFDYAKTFIVDSDFRPLCESERTN